MHKFRKKLGTGSEVSGGSMEPMVRSLTGYEWTRDRVYYLMDYLP